MRTVFVPNFTKEEWRCAVLNCKSLLGIRHTGGALVVKYKDLHAEISGEYQVSIMCRRCGARNTLKVSSVPVDIE